LISLFVIAQPASAVPGPDPAGSLTSWDFNLEEIGTNPVLLYEVLHFERSAGWDYGDREGYQCSFVERFDAAGGMEFALELERAVNYVPGIRINTRSDGGTGNGESHPTGDICGSPAGQGSWVPSGEDHFPHMTAHADPATHGVRLYRDGVLDAAITNDLNAMLTNADCDRGYWTPGDEPNELVLWWDADFPENGHSDGTQPLDCGGGGQEPAAVARMYFRNLAPNIGVCILDHDRPSGARCSGMTAPQPPGGDQRNSVSLRLRGHLRAFGFVNARGGGAECLGSRTVRVERRVSGGWRTMATDLTSATGFYSVRLGDREGTYRTRVVGTTLATGDVCQTGVSPKREHRD
jgi:hypothetical protein